MSTVRIVFGPTALAHRGDPRDVEIGVAGEFHLDHRIAFGGELRRMLRHLLRLLQRHDASLRDRFPHRAAEQHVERHAELARKQVVQRHVDAGLGGGRQRQCDVDLFHDRGDVGAVAADQPRQQEIERRLGGLGIAR